MMQATERMAMNRRSFFAFAGAAGVAGAAAMVPHPLWAMVRDTPELFPTVRAKLASYVAEGKVAGMLAAIGRGTDPAAFISEGTLTLRGDSAVDAETLWRVYSMTKPITGMAAMMLIGDGKMKLDQPIADFLPGFADMRVLTDPAGSLDSVPAKTQITVRHLLTHTAGLGYSIITKGPLLDAYLDNGITPGAVSREQLPGFEARVPTASGEEFIERLARLPLIAQPGTRWSYSIALDLMGLLIEKVSGMEFGAFLQSRMFDPLQMTSSYFQVPEEEVARLSTNYAVIGKLVVPVDPGPTSIFTDAPAFTFGGAGLVCSARDYDRFLAMLLGKGTLDGVEVMRSDMVALGTSNLLPEGADISGSFVTGQGFGAGGRVGIGQAEGTYGWGGAAGTVAGIDAKRGIRSSGYTQYMPSEAYAFQAEFIGWGYKDLMAQS